MGTDSSSLNPSSLNPKVTCPHCKGMTMNGARKPAWNQARCVGLSTVEKLQRKYSVSY